MLDAAETAAGRLGVGEMRRQVDRIRRDYTDDPGALIVQVKELVESACKTILGLTGTGPETQQDVPALVTRTLRHLGLHPDSLSSAHDPTESKAVKRVFGGLTAVLQGTAELRNASGTGHGRSGVPLVTPALARLAADMALPAGVYLCEAYDTSTGSDSVAARRTTRAPAATPSLRGVRHEHRQRLRRPAAGGRPVTPRRSRLPPRGQRPGQRPDQRHGRLPDHPQRLWSG